MNPLRHAVLILFALCIFFHPANAVAAADLDVMIGQMLMVGFRGYAVDAQSSIVRDIRDYHLGGVVLFDYDVELKKYERNIENPMQVSKLTGDLKSYADIPLLVSVDQEGGRVQRLKPEYGFVGTPSAQELGIKKDDLLTATGSIVGQTLHLAGFNLDFAPVVDVNANPESPAIGKMGRSFSTDAGRVARCAYLFMKGMKPHGVISCIKHFPGHGSAGADSHLGLTDVTDTWSEDELVPYEMLIKKGAVEMIMTAHIFNTHLDPDYPATLSHKVITGLLRNKMGFDGVVVTDDMNMKAISECYGLIEAIRLSIEAGADILLFGNNLIYDPDTAGKVHGIIKKLVHDGVIDQSRIAASYARIMRLKASLQ